MGLAMLNTVSVDKHYLLQCPLFHSSFHPARRCCSKPAEPAQSGKKWVHSDELPYVNMALWDAVSSKTK